MLAITTPRAPLPRLVSSPNGPSSRHEIICLVDLRRPPPRTTVTRARRGRDGDPPVHTSVAPRTWGACVLLGRVQRLLDTLHWATRRPGRECRTPRDRPFALGVGLDVMASLMAPRAGVDRIVGPLRSTGPPRRVATCTRSRTPDSSRAFEAGPGTGPSWLRGSRVAHQKVSRMTSEVRRVTTRESGSVSVGSGSIRGSSLRPGGFGRGG